MRRISLCVVALLFALTSGYGQNLKRSFPFTISSYDSLQQTMLPGGDTPIDPLSRVSVVDGHFVLHAASTHPKRLRLFGTELWVSSQFLAGDKAKLFAMHLHKLGFNAIRLSYNDYNGGLCYTDPKTGSFTPYAANFALFDTLLYELKNNGIYVFLTLHYAHRFSEADGVAQWDSTTGVSNFVHFIDTRAAELHRAWAKTLLGHINPLTKSRLADDEGIAAIEIAGDQELSLFAGWRNGYLNYSEGSAAPNGQNLNYHRSRRLDTLFSQFLIRKYKSDAGINNAWRGSVITNPPNQVANGSFEQIGSPEWSLAITNGIAGDKSIFTPAYDSQYCLLLLISKLSPNPNIFDFYLLNTSVRLKKDSLYEMKFWAKIRYNPAAPVLSRSMTVILNQSNTGANSINQTPMLDTTWKEFSYTFRCAGEGAQNFYFGLGDKLGDVMLDAVSIKRKEEYGLVPGETSATAMIGRLTFGATKILPAARFRDMMLFYDSLQNSYFSTMYKCIRDTIKSPMMINNYCPVYWGVYTDAYANRNSDFTGGGINIDYPYYSAVPAVPVADSSWQILNASLLADAGAGSLSRPVSNSIDGKPHILSAFWSPAMNQHQMEIAPFFASYASLQDWDGMFIGPYAYYPTNLDSDFVLPSIWWAMAGNGTMLAQMPQASDMFRNFKVAPAETQVTLTHDDDDVLLWGLHPYEPFGVEGNVNANIATKYRVRNSFGSTFHKIASEYPYLVDTATKVSETGEIKWSQTGSWYKVTSPMYQAAVGYFNGDTVDIGSVFFSRTDANADELSASITALDGQNLSSSSNIFLTIGTRSQNTGWMWSGDTTFHNTWGRAPILMSAATVQLLIASDSANVVIHPIDATGKLLQGSFDAVRVENKPLFVATIDQTVTKSPWYMIEKFGSPSAVGNRNTAAEFSLRIYPNPVSDVTSLYLTLPTESAIHISVMDILGRVRLIVADGRLAEGEHSIPLAISNLEAGHYIIKCETSNGIKTASLIVKD